MRVLIAYGSRWGSTEEVAGRLAGFLGEEGVEAVVSEAFGPVLDMGAGSRMGFVDRRIAGVVMLGLGKDRGLGFDVEGRNDLRDWDRVRDFAHRFAESLRE